MKMSQIISGQEWVRRYNNLTQAKAEKQRGQAVISRISFLIGCLNKTVALSTIKHLQANHSL